MLRENRPFVVSVSNHERLAGARHFIAEYKKNVSDRQQVLQVCASLVPIPAF
jgi:hypothetical protein